MTFLTALIPPLILVVAVAAVMLHRFGREVRDLTERYERRLNSMADVAASAASVAYSLACHAAVCESCEVCGQRFDESPVMMRVEPAEGRPRSITLAHPFCSPPSLDARDVLVWT